MKQEEEPKPISVFFEAFCLLQTYYKMPTRTKEPFTDMALTKDGILGKVWVNGALGCQTEERGSRIPLRININK